MSASVQQSQDAALVEGVVTKAGTSDPVPRARVTLTRDSGPAQPVTATTDGGGKFTFQNVQPGRYRIAAARDGYVKGEYGQRAPAQPGVVVTIAARQEMKDVHIALTPTGAIAGRVFDRFGEPVGNANVQALKYSYQDGRRVLNVAQSARTNDLGEYRMFWMQPGQYIVSAVPADGRADALTTVDVDDKVSAVISSFRVTAPALAELAAPSATAGDPGQTYLTIYYPGTTDAAGAAPIDLRPGANFTGVDLNVVDTRAIRIRGRVISPRQSQTGVSLTLIPRGAVVPAGQLQRQASTNNEGIFEFKGVAPGAYDLVASSGPQFISLSDTSTNGSGQTTTVTRQAFVFNTTGSIDPSTFRGMNGGSNEPRMIARIPLDVGTADIDDVTITLSPGFTLNGKVTIEGPANGNSTPTNMRVSIRPDPLIPQLMPPPVSVAADGTFTIKDLISGDYRISVSAMPRGGYVKGVRLSGADTANLSIHLDGEPRGPLDILVGTNPGSLDASVRNEKQEAVSGVTVVLIPDGARRQRSELYRSATSDASGRIHLDNVIPGDYKLFAWEAVENGVWQDPEFIRNFEDRGKPVHISEGARELADVRVIPYN